MADSLLRKNFDCNYFRSIIEIIASKTKAKYLKPFDLKLELQTICGYLK